MDADAELPEFVRRAVRWVDRLTAVCAGLSALCMAGIFVLIIAEVAARNVAGTSLDFSWDYAAYMMGAVFMLAAAGALKSGAHVRVTVLREVVPPGARRRLDLAACLVGIVVVSLLLWSLSSMAWLSAERGSTSATVIRTPLWVPQSVLATGAVVLLLQMLAQTVRVFYGQSLSGDAPKAVTSHD